MSIGRRRDRDRSRTLVHRDALGLLALVLLLLWLAPALARAQGADSLVLRWTAPGDDGMVGTAAYYELRLSTSAITPSNFQSGLVVPGTPAPLPGGTRQSFVVRDLVRGTTYWFAMRTLDERGNWSGISNIVRFDWPPDASPPASPSGVAGGVQPGGSAVRVTWRANSEADLAGYRVYRAVAASGPWTRVTSTGATAVEWTDSQLPQGAEELWYAVSAFDRSGGEGARSASVSVSLLTPFPAAPLAWGLEAAYPNPARAGELAHVPVAVPAGGGDAHLDVLDSAGRQVRRFELGSAAPGIVDVAWDGRNDAGRACAPGVYRAVLVAPGATRFVLLARVP